MNEFDESHEQQHAPSPAFRAGLRTELRRAYRAEAQFGVAPRSAGVSRLAMVIGMTAGAIVILTIGLVLGASTGYASAEVLDARTRQAESTGIATRRQLAATRLELARTNYEAVRREFDAGTATIAALRLAKAEVDSMQANVARVEVDFQVDRAALPEPRAGLSLWGARSAITALACGASALAPQVAPAQQGVPVVGVTTSTARTTTTLGAVLGVRELPGGRLLVNDAGRRQIRLFDSTLANGRVTIDSTLGAANSYGSAPSQIIPYLGDSTLFPDRVAQTVVVLDRNGQIARALALPTYEDGITPFTLPFPAPSAMDSRGRLLAHGGYSVRRGVVADSSLIFRADLDTRQVDVVGSVYSAGGKNRNDPPEDGKRVVTTIRQPVPTEDSWSVLSDGTVAFVRGRDYHVDWIHPDGTKSSTDKLPFDWKRLTDEDKQKLIDSARVVADSMMNIRNRRWNPPGEGGRGAAGGDGQPGRTGRSGGGAADPASGQMGSIQRIEFPPLSEIPDYYPPIHPNASMPDLDGNLWILPTTSAQSQHGELVYDVVNPKKGLFERVRMPVGKSVAGFGKGGVVYLMSGDRTNGFYLERVKVGK